MSDLPEYVKRYTKYKWEFLRRNPEYRKEWEKLQSTVKKIYDECPSFDPPGGITREEIDFCKKWNIFSPLCPDKSFYEKTKGVSNVVGMEINGKLILDEKARNELDEKRLKRSGNFIIEKVPDHEAIKMDGLPMLEEFMFKQLYLPEEISGRPIRVQDGWDYKGNPNGTFHKYVSKKVGVTGRIEIEVDLNYSKKRLMEEFKGFINEWKKYYEKSFKSHLEKRLCEEKGGPLDYVRKEVNGEIILEFPEFERTYKQELKKIRQRYRKKYHFDNFDQYLHVYDLKAEGKSWKEITELLGLNDIQTARNHYKAACEVIAKGIELYVK